MNKFELNAKIGLFTRELQNLTHIKNRDVNCRGCIHGDKRTPTTCTKWKMQPPEDVQATGCDDWSWDEIPF